MLIFDWLEKDRLLSHIEVDRSTREVQVTDYIDDPLMQFLGKRPHTIEEVNYMMERRCFERTRRDRDVLLELLGLTQYCPLDICMKTHGRMWNDYFWMRFSFEPDLKWSDFGEIPRSDGEPVNASTEEECYF